MVALYPVHKQCNRTAYHWRNYQQDLYATVTMLRRCLQAGTDLSCVLETKHKCEPNLNLRCLSFKWSTVIFTLTSNKVGTYQQHLEINCNMLPVQWRFLNPHWQLSQLIAKTLISGHPHQQPPGYSPRCRQTLRKCGCMEKNVSA